VSAVNIKLNIVQPGRDGVSEEILFTNATSKTDPLRIPYRYPFADIANYAALKARGYFRHETTEVSSLLGGSSATNTEGKLGFQLPPTEKLVLLVKRKGIVSAGTPDQKIVIKGSRLYSIPDIEIEFDEDENFTSGEKLYTIDLYNFGLYISGVEGEDGITIFVEEDTFTNNKSSMEFALIARMG
jgi:hypothetical protein